MTTNFQQRERSTSKVLDLVNKLRRDIGVTRLANITDLDNIGIPVYCSYRPKGYLLQANAGKGYTHDGAKCSAMMEALEYSELEKFDKTKVEILSSLSALRHDYVLPYSELDIPLSKFFSIRTPIDWINLNNLTTNQQWLCPSDLVYITRRQYTQVHTNGLASGNSNDEATLHALYELIERDAYAQILINGKLEIRKIGKSIDLDTFDNPVIQDLLLKIRSSDNDAFLIMLPSVINVYSFWCVVLDRFSLISVGSFNIGLGCHADPEIAAIRAITEAVQSRLIYIHGNREDIRHKVVFNKDYSISDHFHRFFSSLKQHDFHALCNHNSPCLLNSIANSKNKVVEELNRKGYANVFAHVLRDEQNTFSVVKVIVPGLRCENKML